MVDLTGQVAIVTGASRGIGAATARELAQCGAAVVLAARDQEALAALAKDIQEKGGQALAMACDVSRYDGVQKLVDTAVETYGRLDILVNNAGVIEPIARLAQSDPADWDRAIDINLKGVYYGLRAAIPVMEKQGRGVVVNVSSGAASSALEGWSHYCASKAGALSLTRCAHKEVFDKGIRVVGLSPGTVATDMQVAIKQSGINPVSQLDPAVHIPADWPARAIAWLCSDAAGELSGDDVSLRSEDFRRLVGLPTG
ncbi:MAG: SDR family oxidoreductase [Pseudomonadota bacterium]